MRVFPEEFQRRLDSGATTLCRAWRVERKDGWVRGFTDHDSDLVFEGLTFVASSGLDAGALQTSTGLSVDNGLAVGALSDASISEEDVRHGKFDGARVSQWLVDWTRPDLRVVMFRGTFGEIRRLDGRFEVELRGMAEALNTPVGRTILRTCDRVLGDSKCGFDLAKPGFSLESWVADGSSGTTIVIPEGDRDLFKPNWFLEGRIKWLPGGRNAGEFSVVKAETQFNGKKAIVLWETPPAPMKVGDPFLITAGCDKRLSTCRSKFNNIINFRGFPHIPGDDWVMAYPKDGSINDGGSQQ